MNAKEADQSWLTFLVVWTVFLLCFQNGESLTAKKVREGVPGVTRIRSNQMADRYKIWVQSCIDKFDEQVSSLQLLLTSKEFLHHSLMRSQSFYWAI